METLDGYTWRHEDTWKHASGTDWRTRGLDVAWKHGSETNWRTHGLEVAWKHGSETDWRTHGWKYARYGGGENITIKPDMAARRQMDRKEDNKA